MNEGRGNCHNPLDGNHHTAVTFDTDKLTLNSLEDATGDTDTVSLFHGNDWRIPVSYTHLDVYKRQLLKGDQQNLFRIGVQTERYREQVYLNLSFTCK